MARYIDKDKLLLELTRRLEGYKEEISKFTSKYLVADIIAKEEECKELISFLNTLEVKEVNLAKEIKDWFKNGNITDTRFDTYYDGDIENTAKHFFELGLKAHKVQDEIKIGETKIYLEDDGGEPPYDGKQWLDLSCMEYEIPEDKFKDGDNVEIIIRKTQKGE